MCDEAIRHAIALAIAASLAGGAPARAQVAEPPDVLTAAEHGTVTQFAMAVARTRTPLGVYLLDRESDLGSHIDRGATRAASLLPTDAISLFSSSNPDYRGDSARDRAVLIAAKAGSPCAAMARKARRSFDARGSALEVLYQVYRTWAADEGPYLPPGLLGNDDRDAYLAEVSVSVADAPMEDALFDLVEQVPGLGWSVKEERGIAFGPGSAKRGCSVGLLTGRSWLQTDWVIPSPSIK